MEISLDEVRSKVRTLQWEMVRDAWELFGDSIREIAEQNTLAWKIQSISHEAFLGIQRNHEVL